jgi:hypothetical protein
MAPWSSIWRHGAHHGAAEAHHYAVLSDTAITTNTIDSSAATYHGFAPLLEVDQTVSSNAY